MKVEIGKIYKHYKGQKYAVLHLGRDSETTENVVIYEGLYTSEEFGDRPIWVRPVSEFIEEIEKNGKRIQRFALVEENE